MGITFYIVMMKNILKLTFILTLILGSLTTANAQRVRLSETFEDV